MLKVANITFGYSDSEDRLWLRLILLDQQEVQIWMTRLLAKKVCCELLKLLTTHSEEELITQDPALKKELFNIRNLTWDKTPPPNQDKNSSSLGGLCRNVEITIVKENWQLVIHGAQRKKFFFITNRQNIIKIFFAIIQKIKFANWGVNDFDELLTNK